MFKNLFSLFQDFQIKTFPRFEMHAYGANSASESFLNDGDENSFTCLGQPRFAVKLNGLTNLPMMFSSQTFCLLLKWKSQSFIKKRFFKITRLFSGVNILTETSFFMTSLVPTVTWINFEWDKVTWIRPRIEQSDISRFTRPSIQLKICCWTR